MRETCTWSCFWDSAAHWEAMVAAGTPLWTFEPPIQRLGTEHAQLRGHGASLGRVAPGQLGRLEEADQTRTTLSITEAVARCREGHDKSGRA